MHSRNRVLSVLVAALLMAGIVFAPVPVSATPIPTGVPVLVLQQVNPWNSTSHITLLTSLGYVPTVADWSQVGTGATQVHLADFRCIYIASDQPQAFYNTYATRSSELASWVANGGRLVFSVCYQSYNSLAPLPGGVLTNLTPQYNNYIVTASHPIVTGELSDGIPLIDADLHGNYCSHVDMNTLPAGATVILRDAADPTLVEYPYGAGTVIASGLTWEYSYPLGYPFATKAYDDLFLYGFPKVVQVTVTAGDHGTITPGTGPVTYHSSPAYVVQPTPGYLIATVTVDGVAIQEAVNMLSYTVTLPAIEVPHTIAATFKSIPDILAPTITLPKYGSVAGVTNWVDGTVPTFTVRFSPFPLTFTLEDNSGAAKWSISVNGAVIVDPMGSGLITYPVPLAEGRNDVVITAVDTAGNQTTQGLVIYLDSVGPVIVLSPIPASVSSPVLTVAGTVMDAVSGLRSVTIDGTPVVLFLDGSFSEKLALMKGVNTVLIEATDKAGNTASQTFTVTYGTSSAAPSSIYVVLTIGSGDMEVNGMTRKLDDAPFIKDGRTLLPIRALIEVLGGSVEWNATTKTATVMLGSRTVALTIGSKTALVNGKPVALDVAPMIVKGRTFLPLRAVGENVGLDLAWEPVSQTISLTYWP